MTLTLVPKPTPRPLILDVDGTLLRSDLTHEMILEAVKRDPLKAVHYARLGLRDKPAMKDEMVARIRDRIAFGNLPLEPKIVQLAHNARAEGRSVHLCSGSEQSLVDELAEGLDFIDEAYGTKIGWNMTSERKASFLSDRFPDGFDYAGNSTQDYKVWEAAHSGYGMRPPHDTPETRTAAGEPVTILEERSHSFGPLLRALRPVMWPLALGAALPSLAASLLGRAVDWSATGWVVLCGVMLLAAVSLADDLADIQRDRKRADMRDRPLANGTLAVTEAVGAMVALWIVGLAVSLTTLGWPAALGFMATFFVSMMALRHSGRSAVLVHALVVGIGLLSLGTLAL